MYSKSNINGGVYIFESNIALIITYHLTICEKKKICEHNINLLLLYRIVNIDVLVLRKKISHPKKQYFLKNYLTYHMSLYTCSRFFHFN